MSELHQLDLLHWVPKGETYRPELDRDRLSAQMRAVYDVLATGSHFTLRQLADAAKCPEASASARFRDLRAMEFPVRSQRVSGGTWEYYMEGMKNAG